MPCLVQRAIRRIISLKHLGASPQPLNRGSAKTIKQQRQSHRATFLAQFDLSNRSGLEIGPFTSPVFTRDDYPDILYADVMREKFLRSLARQSGKRREEDVVPLDFELKGRRLDEVIPHGSLDFVFCSHVLEHMPDMIAGLQSIERILKPGGIFLFFFPDRRFTYDIDRPATTLAQLQERHARRIKKPDPEIVLEHFLNSRHVDAARLWLGLDRAKGALKHSPETAHEFSERARSSYVDVHCNIFSDKEFVDAVEALRSAGMIHLQVHKHAPTQAPSHEFHLSLIKPRREIDS